MTDTTRDLQPPAVVHDVGELFELAVAMEKEAARRYADLAERMTAAGHAELAELFRTLEKQEYEHAAGIAAWAGREQIDVSDLPDVRWRAPETLSEDEFADAGGELLMTAEGALNLAILNEERAFAFYIRVATEALDAQVREHAERMASEELDHVALLRLERRRAGRRRRTGALGAFEDPETMADQVRAQMQAGAERLRAAAAGARAAGWRRIATQLDDLAGTASGATQAPATDVAGLVDAELQRTENVYEALLRTVENTRLEALVTAAQAQAEEMLARLARLSDVRSALRKLPPAMI